MIDERTQDELRATARRIRRHLVQMSNRARAAHLGSALSCVDLLVYAYWRLLEVSPTDHAAPQRDRFLLSKGHAAAALYATLAERGFFPVAELQHFGEDGGSLSEQMSPGCVAGVEAATGSLGHGLPLGAGMALASRIVKCDFQVCVLMSDGECNEGSVWEAAMFAAAQQLSNLTVVVDYNGWQATGRSDDVLRLAPLADKWRAFGFETCEVDGHDFAAIENAVADGSERTRPLAVVARTTKGRGVSFMEDDNNWHYRIPNDTEVAAALAELEQSS